MKDKRKRLTVRLTDEQFQFVKDSADALDVSPSELLRMVVATTMLSNRVAKEHESDIIREVLGCENDETDIDYKL